MDFKHPERCQRQRTGPEGPPFKVLRGLGQPQMFSLLDQGASGLQIYDGWDGYYEHHGAFGYWGILAYNAISSQYTPRKTFPVIEQFSKFVPRGARRVASGSSNPDIAV